MNKRKIAQFPLISNRDRVYDVKVYANDENELIVEMFDDLGPSNHYATIYNIMVADYNDFISKGYEPEDLIFTPIRHKDKKIEIKIELRQGAKPYKSLPEFIVKDGKVWELSGNDYVDSTLERLQLSIKD